MQLTCRTSKHKFITKLVISSLQAFCVIFQLLQQQQQMKKQQMTKQELLSDDQDPDYLDVLKRELKNAQSLVMGNNKYASQRNKWHVDRNTAQANFREDKIYTMFTAEAPVHFQTHWSHIEKLYPHHKPKVVSLANKRIKSVIKDLLSETLKIEERPPLLPFNYEEELQHQKLQILKGQSQELRKKLNDINSSLTIAEDGSEQAQIHSAEKDLFSHLYTEQKLKATEEYIQKQKKEKQERRKKIQEQRKKQILHQKKIQEEQKEIEGRKAQAVKDQFMKKQIQLKKKREQQQTLRQQRNSEYMRVKKQMQEKPRLFERLLKSYSQKKEYYELEMKQQAKLNRKNNRYMHIDQMGLQEHEKDYQQLRRKKEQEREKRHEEYLQMEQKSRVRHHSSYELERSVDHSLISKEKAKERTSKMKEYQILVKEKYQPKIDEQKKKQMLTLIEQKELNARKKYKKKVLEDGNVLYEEIKDSDTRQIGMKYLEMTKQMASRARSLKGNSIDKNEPITSPQKKPFDYLEYLRANPRPKPSRLSFVTNNSLSYDQKMERVMAQSQKLAARTKVNEDKLKYGNFRTSQQILDCKEQVDQNYIDIAFMKLKMIKEQPRNGSNL